MSVNNTAKRGEFDGSRVVVVLVPLILLQETPTSALGEKGNHMPNAVMLEKLNAAMSFGAVQALADDPGDLLERLATPGSLVEVAESVLGEDVDVSYLRDMPSALQEAIRAAVSDALQNGKAVQLQFSPAYDFGVKIWDFGDAVSVHVSGPYPTGGRALGGSV